MSKHFPVFDFPMFDSHLHIIDPRFPLTPNNGYLPEPFSCDDYMARMSAYQLCGGAVVSGSFQAFDQTYLVAALKTLGEGFVGVTQIPASTSDEEILALNEYGVRAIRFNLKRGGSEDLSKLSAMAARVYELARWHVELYVDANDLAELSAVLQQLPAVSIDHLGLSQSGLKFLYPLAEKGVKVKATGFGRTDFAVAPALKQLYAINPECLMFGTDLPSTRAPVPYSDDHFQRVADTLGEAGARKVFSRNALAWYRPGTAHS